MTAWLLRRVIQALFVMFVMTVLVFFAVNVIGNPVDILIPPEANQAERARIIAELGLDQPLWAQYLQFVKGALQGNLGKSYVYQRVRTARHPAPDAGDAGARFLLGDPRDPDRHSAWALCGSSAGRTPVQDHHGRQHPRLLAADILGRADADHDLRRPARLAAERRPRRDRRTVRRAMVVPDARRPDPSDPAGAQPVAVQGLARAAD